MLTRVLKTIIGLLLTLPVVSQVQVARENVIISNQIHGFWEYLPADYNSSTTKRYPLIVEWHGVGETGNGSLPAMEMVRIHGLARVVKAGIFPQSVTFNGQSYSYIVLSPQYIDPVGMSVLDIDAFLNYAFAHYRVDRNRVYLTGYSLGAMLIYQYAGFTNTYAQKITGIVPLSPCFDANAGLAQTIAVNNVAVWGIHGNQDVQCPWSWTVNWSNSINTANNGVPPSPHAVYSLIPGPNPNDAHDIFWFTYEPGFSAPPVNKNIYNWMIQYSRNISLPITLKNFSAEFKDQRTLIEWTTSNESRAKEFFIERAGKDLQFRSIGSMPASGSSTTDKIYKFVDEQPIDGINYYRLQLVNIDNSNEYFEVKKVLASKEGKISLLSANPVRSDLKLTILLSTKENLTFSITDINGRVLQRRSALFPQGIQEITLSTARLASGSYLIQIRGESFIETKKFIRQ